MNRLNQHPLTRRRWLLALTTILSGSAVHAAVLPRGASVVGGLASIVANGPGLTVNQTSQRAIIDWNSFSVGPGAWVHFVQPGATSAILNRVTGGNPSQIYGAIQANGQVFVINPNGVVVGPTGVIQAGAFVASTLNVTDPAFMSGGPIAFVGGSAAAVQNFGFITAADGDTVLIGRKVDNAGTLQASQGAVALAAGSEILLQPSSDQRLVVQAGLPTGGTGADNTGAIKAAQAELIAAGGNAYALAVNAAGTIQAVGVAHVNGRVVLTAAGGDVQVSGSVSAQNADGSGGQIEVGGGSRGQDPGVVDAANATITASGRLDASASGPVGDGGQITVWSNGKTVFAGQIDAKGGASAGQGGAVEVSGGWESITGKVDTLAPHGATGSLLLDPDSAIIDTNPTTLAGGVSGIVSGATTTYSASAIEALLAGTDVTIQTNAAISGGTGDITLEDTSGRNTAFALSNFTGNLLIEAANNLDIKVPVSVSATTPASTPYNQTTGTVTFQAGQTITVSAPLTLNAIAVGVNGGSSAATTLGAVSFLATQGAINFTATAPITLTAVAQGGAATLTGSGISVNANAGGDANVTLNGLTLQAGDGLTIAAPVQMSLIAQGGGSASGYHTNAVNGGAASIAPGLFSFAAGAGALTLTAPVTVSESATGGAGADVSNDGYANVGPGGAARIGPWPASAPWSSSSIPWSPGLAFSGASIDLGSGVVGPAGSVTASAIANGGTGGASGYDDTLSTVAGGPGGAATVYAPGINFDSLGAFSLGATDLLKSGVTANSGAYGSAYNGTQAPGGGASAVAGDIDITAASAALTGTVRLTAAASDAGGVDATGIVNVGALKLTANAGAVTLDGSISSSATMDGALIGDVPSPFGDFIFSGGDLAITAAGDILSNISQSLAAFAGVAPSAGAASLSGLAAITLAAGDSVLMPGATFALPLQTDPGRTGLVIAADTAGTAGQVGGVTGALDLYGATLPPILSLTTPTGPNVSIWGVDGALMNLGEAYAATPGAAYFGNAHYLPGDFAAGVHCQSVSCGAPVLTITANSVETTYGAAIPAFTAAYSGLAYGDGGAGSANDNITAPQFSTRYVLTGSQITPNVGTYAITPVPGAAPGYYSRVNAVAGSLTITAAPLTIAADNAVMTYGGAAPVLGDTITGLVNGDTASALGTLVLANLQAASSNAGTYTGAITVSGAADSNYAITYAPGSLTINPAPLLITAANAVMTYGGALPAFATTFGTVVGGVIEDGLVNGDTPASIASLTVATTAGTHPNAGTYVLTPSGGRDPNYTISYAPGALTVDPAPLTLGASAIEDFGRGSPTYTATYSGLVNGDAASVLGPLTYSSSVPLTSPVGSYPGAILAAGARDPNYAITYVAGPLTINPFGTLTVTANSFTIDYGAALPNFTASYAGLKPGDTSAVVTGLKFSTTATLGANVGTYQIRPYGASAPSYYTLVYADGVLTIAPAPVTVTAANASIVYGAAAMPLLGVSVSGLVDNDAAAQVVSAAPTTTARLGSNAGTYAIAPNATLLNPNYTLIQVDGVFTITPAPLTITVADASMTYGGATPIFGAAFSGLVNGDTPAALLGLSFISQGGSSSNAGRYPILVSGGTDPNYVITDIPGVLVINPAPLLVTAPTLATTFGAAIPTLTDLVSGLVNGDTAATVLALAPSTSATSVSDVGTYPTDPGARLLSANYSLTTKGGALTINPATLTLSLVAADVTRGDTPQACLSGCDGGEAPGATLNGTSVYASQYQDPATQDTLVWTASGFTGGDAAFSGAPTLKGDGVTGAYSFTQGSFTVSKNYLVKLIQPTGTAWLNVAAPPLIVSTGTIYVYAQNPLQPPPYTFTGLRGSDASLDGQDLSNTQFSYTTDAQLGNTSGGTYQVTPSGPSLYYPVPGDPYGPYSVTYTPGDVVVLPTVTPAVTTPSTTLPTSTGPRVLTRSMTQGFLVTTIGSVPQGLAIVGVSNAFGIPVAFGLQIDTIVGMYLASQNAPHDQRAINNWISANQGSATATGDIEPFLIQYLQDVESYATATPSQQATIVSALGHVPSPSDYRLDTAICTDLQAARTQAAQKANADYQTWLNQQSSMAASNHTMSTLFGQLVSPPPSILAEAQAGISVPANASASAVASVAAGAAAGGITAGVLSSGSSAAIRAVSFGLARAVANGGDVAADVIAGASSGPLIIATAAAAIAIQGIVAVVNAAEFPGKLAAATAQAESYQSITQLMAGATGQAGLATDLAGILTAGLPGGGDSATGG